jgi:hypothetical protein
MLVIVLANSKWACIAEWNIQLVTLTSFASHSVIFLVLLKHLDRGRKRIESVYHYMRI